MTTKKRGGLGLGDFKPTPKGGKPEDVEKSDAVARDQGFTSREERETHAEPARRPPGRPKKKQPRKQLNFVANLPDIEWFSELRDELGVNGAKLFSDMRAAYEKQSSSR